MSLITKYVTYGRNAVLMAAIDCWLHLW